MTDTPEATPPCCEVWSSLVPTFDWYRFDDFPELLAMPCVQDHNGQQWRINYCPSCGAPRRDAITREWRSR